MTMQAMLLWCLAHQPAGPADGQVQLLCCLMALTFLHRAVGAGMGAGLVGSLLIPLDHHSVFAQKFQRELSTKWILNTVSTGAYVLKGKILRNCMVDLRIGNSKLFWRAVSILQVLAF